MEGNHKQCCETYEIWEAVIFLQFPSNLTPKKSVLNNLKKKKKASGWGITKYSVEPEQECGQLIATWIFR